MPFGQYKDFADCVAKNADKKDPKAYCGTIKAAAEASMKTTIHDLRGSEIFEVAEDAVFEEVDGRMMATVRILKAGVSKNRRNYPAHVVKEAVDKHLFDGIRMFVNHNKKSPSPLDRSLSEMVSAVESTSWDEKAQAMDGRVEFFDRNFFDYAQRAKNYMGVSINALVRGTRKMVGGQVQEDVSGWHLPRSVDWVTFPAAGGAILAFEDEEEMIDWTKITAEQIKENAATVYEAIQAEAKATDDDPPTDDKKKVTEPPKMVTQEEVSDIVKAALEAHDKEVKKVREMQEVAAESVRAAFATAGLPEKTRARLVASYEGITEFDEKAVAAAILTAKEELAAAGVGPRITGMGPSTGDAGDGTSSPVFSAHESVSEAFGITKKSGTKGDDPKEGTK